MLFEDIMLLLLAGSSVFLIGIPVFKLVKTILPKERKNPVADARERLEQARLELEAARLNKESEKLYEQMYNEALEEDESNNQTKGKL